MTGSTLPAPSHQPSAQPGNRPYKHPFQASVLWMPDAKCSLLPAVFFTSQRSQARFIQPPLPRPGTPGPRISHLLSVLYRPSSVVHRLSSVVLLLSSNYSFLFVSQFFTQKHPSLNPLTEHHVPLTDEQ